MQAPRGQPHDFGHIDSLFFNPWQHISCSRAMIWRPAHKRKTGSTKQLMTEVMIVRYQSMQQLRKLARPVHWLLKLQPKADCFKTLEVSTCRLRPAKWKHRTKLQIAGPMAKDLEINIETRILASKPPRNRSRPWILQCLPCSLWHIFWHSISVTLSDIHSGILSDICSAILSRNLSGYVAYMLTLYLPFYLKQILAFYIRQIS